MWKKAFMFPAPATWNSLQKEFKWINDISGRIQDYCKQPMRSVFS